MASRRSLCAIEAIYVLSVCTLHGCSAATGPTSGRAAEASVGADGALADAGEGRPRWERPAMRREEEEQQPLHAGAWPGAAAGAVAVDAEGRSALAPEPPDPSLLAAGDEQYPAPAPPQHWPGSAPSPPSHVVRRPPDSGNHAVRAVAPASGGSPGAPSAGGVGKSCLIPMWAEKTYLCKEYEDHIKKMDTSWLDTNGYTRVNMPDHSTCTVTPPSWWMDVSESELTCRDGTWTESATGVVVTKIQCGTARWFYTLFWFLSFIGLPFLIYKMKYDKDSRLYAWWHSNSWWPSEGQSKEQVGEDHGDAAGADDVPAPEVQQRS